MVHPLCCSAAELVDARVTNLPPVKLVSPSREDVGTDGSTDLANSNQRLKQIFLVANLDEMPTCYHTKEPVDFRWAARHSYLQKISQRLSRKANDSRVRHEKQNLQRSPQSPLNKPAQENELSESTPSVGFYDDDAHLLDDLGVVSLARLNLSVPIRRDSKIGAFAEAGNGTPPASNPQFDNHTSLQDVSNIPHPQPQLSTGDFDIPCNIFISKPRLLKDHNAEQTGLWSKHYDGPSDAFLAPHSLEQHNSQPHPAVSRRKSVGEDFDEAGKLWGRALNNYATEIGLRHRDAKSYTGATRPRRSLSVGNLRQDDAHTIRRYSAILSRPDTSTRDSTTRQRAASTFEIKPLRMPLTFDRLSAEVDADQSNQHQAPPPRFWRSSSQERRCNSACPLFDVDEYFLEDLEHTRSAEFPNNNKGPLITITDTGMSSKSRPLARGDITKDSSSSLAAWSKYPSHTRYQRTLSAGVLDSVFARDFAELVCYDNHASDNEKPQPDLARLDRSKMNTEKSKWRLLLGFPRFLKDRGPAPDRVLRGHRSSVAPGGVVEFPELELVPGSEASRARLPTPFRRDSQMFSSKKSRPQPKQRMARADQPSSKDSTLRTLFGSRWGSSSYGSTSDVKLASADRVTASDGSYDLDIDWKGLYTNIIGNHPECARMKTTTLNRGASEGSVSTENRFAPLLTRLHPRCASLGARSLPLAFEQSHLEHGQQL